MTEVSIAVAVAAGALSFLSPCVLALLPVYVAFLGEASTAGARTALEPDAPLATRAVVLPQAALFVAGFSVVFVVVGTTIGLMVTPMLRIPEVRQGAGIVVILIGVLTTGVFGPIFDRLSIGIGTDRLPAMRSARALALGAVVAVGWTPCIGPVLGAILGMGTSSGSVLVVPLLLGAYSAGLAIPFLAAALAFPHLRPLVGWLRRHHRAVQVVSGLLIVLIGILIFQNAFARLSTLFTFAL